jgi:3-dehydroquinate synthase
LDGITTLLNSIIVKSIDHKMQIISEDVYSTGSRNFLNFGHTIGHILELEYDLSHGFAVAYGMIFETLMAVEMQQTNISIYNEIHRIITKYYTHNLEDFDLNKIIEGVYLDKKRIGDHIRMPIIKEIGRAVLVDVKLTDLVDVAKKVKVLNLTHL